MTTYETLDAIADSYNPILFLVYIAFSIIYFRAGDRIASIKGFLGILICYVIMFLDNALEIWNSLGLDYSAHSSVAFALVFFHIHKRKLKSLMAIGFIMSLIGYYLLELYQQYHTLLDIVSTVIVAGPIIFLIYQLVKASPKMEKEKRKQVGCQYF